MSRPLVSQNKFNAGEVTPRLFSRSDLKEKYEAALEEATNAFVVVHGPIMRRTGTRYVSYARSPSLTARLGKFQFAQDDAFIIELGNLYARFYTNSGQVTESTKTITAITQANPGSLSSTAHGFSNGDHVYIEDVVGMTQINNNAIPYVVANASANAFTLTTIAGAAINTTTYSPYTSGGTAKRIYTLTTPWSDSQVNDLTFAQSGESIYITHPSFEPRILTRITSTNWTLATLSASPPATYESGEMPAFTLTPGATSGVGVTFTASGASFLDADRGRQIINLTSGETGKAIITSVTSSTAVVCTIKTAFTDTSAIDSQSWKLDLSPLADLTWQGTKTGDLVTMSLKYSSGYLEDAKTITAISKASPGSVSVASHGYVNGNIVQLSAVAGMTEVNGVSYRVTSTGAGTFTLGVDTTLYITYTSAGVAQRVRTEDYINGFRSTDVNKFILANGGVFKIITYVDAQNVKCEILKAPSSSTRTGLWSLETETWTSTRGYPRCVGLYQERLVFAGTTAQPTTVWMSESGILTGFGVGPDDADSVEVTLGASEVNQINWIASCRDLVLGTSGGEVTLNGGSNGVAVTPSNISQQPRTFYGSAIQQPPVVGTEILFIQKSGRKVRTFQYDFNIDNYTGEDLTFLAEHISEGGISSLVFSQEPDKKIYAVRTDGKMLCGTYDRSQQVIGWCLYETDGTIESVQTISEGEEDQVWILVSRLVNGVEQKMIEYFDNGDGLADTDAYSDSALSISTPLTIGGISNANPAVVTSTSHGLSNGDKVVIKDVVDPVDAELDPLLTNMSDINRTSWTIGSVTAHTFTLVGLNTTTYNDYGSSGFAYKKIKELSGLQHLEGRTVQVKGDGAVQPSKIVTNGAITAAEYAGEFTVGRQYITTIKTLPKEYDIGMGTMQGQRSRFVRPILRVHRSYPPLLSSEFIPSRSAADLMDQKVPLWSGDLEYGPVGWDNTGQLTVSVEGPFPLQLSGIFGALEGGSK